MPFQYSDQGINRLCPPISRHIPCKRIPCFCKCSFQYLSFFCPCISLSCFRLLRRSPFRRYRFLHTKGKFAPWAVRTTISERSPVGKRMSTGLLLYGAPEKTKRKINHHKSLSAGKRTRFTENRLAQDCILLEKLTCRSFLRTGKGYSVRFFSASARIAARSSSVNSPRRYSMNWRSALPRQRLKRGTFMVKPNCSIS